MPRTLRVGPGLGALIRSVLGQKGHLRLRASGESMRPLLLPGDELVIGPLRPGEPRLGQIVVWEHGRRVIAHRVVELGPEHVITRGDATLHDDPPVPRAALLGVLRGHRRPWRSMLSQLLAGRG